MQSESLPDALRPEGLPGEVAGLMSTRAGGCSVEPWQSLNLLVAGKDDAGRVEENRRRFVRALGGAQPVFLNQVHGTRVLRLTRDSLSIWAASPPEGDACVCTEPGLACTVMVADCLPVLMAAPGGSGVAAAHAGWRGLAAGVVDATLAQLCEAASCSPDQVAIWLGPCIGAKHFEVGDDVRVSFGDAGNAHFGAGSKPGKWWGDLVELAKHRLVRAGADAERISGGGWCTYSEPARFFSFRRDGITGRHAAAIWIR